MNGASNANFEHFRPMQQMVYNVGGSLFNVDGDKNNCDANVSNANEKPNSTSKKIFDMLALADKKLCQGYDEFIQLSSMTEL